MERPTRFCYFRLSLGLERSSVLERLRRCFQLDGQSIVVEASIAWGHSTLAVRYCQPNCAVAVTGKDIKHLLIIQWFMATYDWSLLAVATDTDAGQHQKRNKNTKGSDTDGHQSPFQRQP